MLQHCYKNSVFECLSYTHSLISYLYTQNNEFILNVLLDCIKFLTTYIEF